MKQFIYVIAVTAVVLLSFASCDKAEEPPYVPGPYSWDFGYIKGKLNETDVNLQNEGNQAGKHMPAGISVYSKDSEGKEAYSAEIPITKDQDKLAYGFCIFISPIKTGKFEVTKPSLEYFENNIAFVDKRDDTKEAKIYKPLKQPLILHINRADFSSDSGIPFIEGKMEGILYNEKNLNDSVIVKNMQFGVH